MKRIIFTIIILSASIFVHALLSKFSLGIAGSTEYYKYQAHNIGIIRINPTAISAFHAGLRLKYQFTDKIEFISGLYYSMNKYYSNIYYFESDPVISNPAISIRAIEIPLMIGYAVLKKRKFKITPAVGFVEKRLLYSNDYTISENRLSFQFNLIFDYQISERIFLTLEPYINIHYFQSEDLPNPNIDNNYTGGLLSLNYKF